MQHGLETCNYMRNHTCYCEGWTQQKVDKEWMASNEATPVETGCTIGLLRLHKGIAAKEQYC